MDRHDRRISDVDAIERFRKIWLYCMNVHEVGTLPSGPCMDCIKAYALTGPPER